MSKPPPPLDVGAVFVAARGRPRARRIIAIRDGAVVYCRGADRNYCCRLASFRRWISRVGAHPYNDNPVIGRTKHA